MCCGFKKKHRDFFFHFFQSPHQVEMKNVVECHREFIAYFNALETTCAVATALLRTVMVVLRSAGMHAAPVAPPKSSDLKDICFQLVGCWQINGIIFHLKGPVTSLIPCKDSRIVLNCFWSSKRLLTYLLLRQPHPQTHDGLYIRLRSRERRRYCRQQPQEKSRPKEA